MAEGSELHAEGSELHTWFCAYCGRSAAASQLPNALERVCSLCGFGLLVEALATVAPSPMEAFLVIDNKFAVEAISHQAEELLGVRERFVVRRPLTDLLVPADRDTRAASGLIEALSEATSGAPGSHPSRLLLCPADDARLRLRARVGRCGPPLSALIVLEPTEAERLQLLEHH